MSRPIKWSRDLHLIRERAGQARTETWGRKDLEDLFGVGRATAQMLMKAIAEIQPVGGAHFVERPSLLSFLDAIIAAPLVVEGLRSRMLEAEPPPRPKPLRVSLPEWETIVQPEAAGPASSGAGAQERRAGIGI